MAAEHHAWSGLKPSKARIVVPEQTPAGSGSLRDNVESSMLQQHHPWLVHEPARKPRLLDPDLWGGQPGSLQQPAAEADHRQGWKRQSSNSAIDQRHYRFDNSPCSELKLDAEMTMFESQITRTVSDHLSHLTSLSPSSSTPVVEAAAASSVQEKLCSSEVPLKRRRSSENDMQGGDRGWVHPFTLLVCKGLTLSDIGGLGRIVIPKKDAESTAFPRIDTKEGIVLEMEDFTASKRWYFRFKYWINNKSRMYVLENAGEFVKYHSLEEHDLFIVYEDACKKLVVRGQKKSTDKWDPLLELSKGSIFESSASDELGS